MTQKSAPHCTAGVTALGAQVLVTVTGWLREKQMWVRLQIRVVVEAYKGGCGPLRLSMRSVKPPRYNNPLGPVAPQGTSLSQSPPKQKFSASPIELGNHCLNTCRKGQTTTDILIHIYFYTFQKNKLHTRIAKDKVQRNAIVKNLHYTN